MDGRHNYDAWTFTLKIGTKSNSQNTFMREKLFPKYDLGLECVDHIGYLAIRLFLEPKFSRRRKHYCDLW